MAAIFFALLLAGCGPNPTPKVSRQNVSENAATNSVSASLNQGWRNMKESIQSGVDYTFDKKDEFVTGAAADLAALDQRILELSQKTAGATLAIGTNARVRLEDLRGQRAILYEKLNNLKEATAEDWGDAKTGFETIEDRLKMSLKKSWPRLRAKNDAPISNSPLKK